MTKRDFLKQLPVFSRLIRTIDTLRKDNAVLQATLHQLIIEDVTAISDPVGNSMPLAGGLAVPPAVLRFLVSWSNDLSVFLEIGHAGANWLADIFTRHVRTPDGREARILDFGCGCGRIIRHLQSLPGAKLYGSDCNVFAVQWCRKFLPFAEFQSNGLTPPFAASDNQFDMIFACSVFTHLPEAVQHQWMAEFRRILSPEGVLVITTHGDHFRERLPRSDQERLQKGELVVWQEAYPGANVCGAFHPERYVRDVLTRGYDVLEAIPCGSVATPPQDAYVLRVKK